MADLKITELAALTTVLGEDLLAIVDDPTGTASTKKIRTDDFQSGWHVGARVYNDANISISHETETALTFNTERYDTSSFHSTVSNTDRLTCAVAGYYCIIAQLFWGTSATDGQRILRIYHEGTTIIATDNQINSTGNNALSAVCYYYMAAGEYVNVKVYQSSGGGALNAAYTANFSPEFSIHRIG